MATRLYGVATTPAPISPAFDAGWIANSAARRRLLSVSKAAATETNSAFAITSGAGNNALAFQLISPPLAAQTIAAGTVTVIMRGRELATTDNVNKRWRKVYVVDSTGSTIRGTLVSMAASASTTELGTSLSGTVMAVNAGTSSLAVSAGDRIVVEVGYGLSSTGTTPQADMAIGGNGTDHTTTEADTTGTVPWIEFSQNLTWAPITESVLGLGTGTRAFPDAVVPYNPGKLVVRVAAENGNGVGTLTPSGGGLTWTKQIEANAGDINNVLVQIWTADTASTTPVTVTITPSGGGGPTTTQYAATVDADPGTGIGVSSAGTGKTRTINPATGSHVYGVVGDWSAGATGTIAWTPSGATSDYAEQDAVHMTAWFGEWPSTTAGSVAYGLSTPSPSTPSTAVLEITAGVDARSAATQDSFQVASARPGAKAGSQSTVDSLTPQAQVVKATPQASSGVTRDSVGTSDRPAGTKNAARTAADSTGVVDRPAGAKTPARATVDSPSVAEVVSSRKTPARTTTDSVGTSDRPAGAKAFARAVVDSIAPAEVVSSQPVGPSRPTVDSIGTSDRPAQGAKAVSGSVAESFGPAGVVAARKDAPRSTADTASTTGRPAGAKDGIRTATDSAGVGDRPTGTRASSRTTADSTGVVDRPAIGSKARAATMVDSFTPMDQASKGFASAQATRDTASPQEAVSGVKNARGSTGTAMAPAGRLVASRASQRATVDATTPRAVTAVRKGGVTVGTDTLAARSVLVGRKAAVRVTSDTVSGEGRVLTRRDASGVTRSSMSIDEVIVRLTYYRDITVAGGRLRRDRVAGLVRPRLLGRLGRRPTGTAGGTAPEGDLREHP